MLYSGANVSKRFEWSKADLINIGKVLLYSAVSAALVTAIDLLPQVDFPTQWLWIVPIVNSLLVTIKKFLDNNK